MCLLTCKYMAYDKLTTLWIEIRYQFALEAGRTPNGPFIPHLRQGPLGSPSHPANNCPRLAPSRPAKDRLGSRFTCIRHEACPVCVREREAGEPEARRRSPNANSTLELAKWNNYD